MAKKMTKNEKFEMLKAIPAVAENAMLMEFIEHEQELIERKNSTKGEAKPTARQSENADLRTMIMDILSIHNDMRVSEILGELPASDEITHSRVTALLGQLVKAGLVERVKDGKITLFKAVQGE